MFDQLKPIMQNGERYIVVEQGKPEYVVMRFSDYVALAGGRKSNPGHANPAPARSGEWERVNAVLEEVGNREPYGAPALASSLDSSSAPADPTTIRLEDLPL